MDFIDHKILEQVVIGFEFELYSNLGKKQIAKEIARITGKNVRVGDVYHSETPIGKDQWKVEPDMSGGMKMAEVVTEPMPYYEGMAAMNKVMSWIRSNGWTDEKCALQFNVSFDPYKLKLNNKLAHIDRLKFILNFDEDFVYDRFPKRKNSQYARSINQIIPINKFIFNDNIKQVHRENYFVPGEKYYGINFSKLSKDYVEVRYCGGRGYEKHVKEFTEVINYVCKKLYNTIEDPAYTLDDVEKLRIILRHHKKVVSSFSDLDSFFLNYPNIKVFVDLKGDPQVLKTYWTHIREQLFNLIVFCGMKRGLLNYDADVGKYQLKDAIIVKSFPIKDMEIFDSKIGGNIINCDLFRCVISNAHLVDCNLYGGNIVVKSKIINTPIHLHNECQNCYIDNKKHLINGKIDGGIIRSGEIAPTANVSGETEVIDQLLKGEGKLGYKDEKGAPGNIGRVVVDKEMFMKK